MEEIWKDIVVEKNGTLYDFTGLYQVSNLGRVRSLDRYIDTINNGTPCKKKVDGKILKTKQNKKGYQQIILFKDGKRIATYVHRVVATCFIDNPNNYSVVNHKDENPSNNCVDNLEWCTVSYNTKYSHYKYSGNHGYYPKGSEAHHAKKVICVETGQVFGTIKEAQKYIGQKSGICECCKGKLETAGGYHWQYVYDTNE